MKYIILLSVLLTAAVASATEFTNFKLIKNSHLKSHNLGGGKFVEAFTAGQPPSSNIYDEIEKVLNGDYNDLGNGLAGSVLHRRGNFNLGSDNFSGMTWQKAMGGYNIGIDRQLAPDLFDDKRWIVTDKFFIEISAHSLLSKLKGEGAIEISEGSLAAFAGMEFRRIYTFVHFANSYEEGLTSDYSLLFLPFKKIKINELEKLAEYNILTKEDFWATEIAAAAKISPQPGISLEAGILARFKRLTKLTIQSLGERDPKKPGEKVRISYEKVAGKEIAAESTLAIDFFNLLKITLFQYSLSYSLSESLTSYLSFTPDQLNYVKSDANERNELDRLLSLRNPNLNILAPYLVSKEMRLNESKNSRYALLLFGQMEKLQGEVISIESDGKISTFIKSYQTSLKYMQGFWGALINTLSQILFRTDLSHNYKASRTRQVSLEYNLEATRSGDRGEIYLKNEESFSLLITHEYQVKSTTGRWDKKYRQFATHFASNFTSLPPSVIHGIDGKYVRGPMTIESRLIISREGLNHLFLQDKKYIISQFARICNYDGRGGPWGEAGQDDAGYNCYVKLSEKYRLFYDEARIKGELSIWKLKDFLNMFNNYTDSRYDLILLFGARNIFINGKIKAYVPDGSVFSTTFKEGQFKSLGVVDDFRIENQMRTPASIAQ